LVSAFVRTSLDTLLALLADRVGAGFGQSILDTALARTAIVALFAGLLTVDTSVLDLLSFGLGQDIEFAWVDHRGMVWIGHGHLIRRHDMRMLSVELMFRHMKLRMLRMLCILRLLCLLRLLLLLLWWLRLRLVRLLAIGRLLIATSIIVRRSVLHNLFIKRVLVGHPSFSFPSPDKVQ
jgi:hypothetical protein